jgi:DNA-binding response OmpR family regulator
MAHSILVVDDAENTRGILTYLLKNKGYSVRAATNGEDALRLIESAAPDLVVLDAMMPRLSGYEVCARVKAEERTRAIPVILLTAQPHEAGETVTRWKPELRPNEVMAKPFKIQELLARIEGLLKPAPGA